VLRRADVCPTPLCTSSNINNWALDITKDYTYTVVHGVLGDLASLFFENLMHLGGDEVDYECWGAHPYIVDWLNTRNLTFGGGYEYYVKRAQSMAWDLGKEVVGWEEIWNHFGTSLDKRTSSTMVAHSVSLPLNVTSNGYRLIWSDAAHWYLDHLGVTWELMYDSEPCIGLPPENCALILGGEGCQWARRSTPRRPPDYLAALAAIAERLWSPYMADRVRLEQDPCPHVRLPVPPQRARIPAAPWTTQRPAKRPQALFVLPAVRLHRTEVVSAECDRPLEVGLQLGAPSSPTTYQLVSVILTLWFC